MRAVILLSALAMAACNLVSSDLEESAYDPDGDGVAWPEDCDSTSADVYPGAAELPYDGVDQDCAGDDDYDQDGDGFVPAEFLGLVTQGVPGSGGLPGGDCWDEIAGPPGATLPGSEIHPDAEETWYDGVDQDCDGASDFDADADGFDHLDHDGEDCDDEQPGVNPDADEVWYDGVDQDCDDNDCDADGDGLDADPDTQGYCDQIDCDDTDPEVGGTGSEELWYDGVDQDCDGNDGDQDGDGYWAADYDALVTASGGSPLPVPTGYEGDCWDVPSDVGGLPTDYTVINSHPLLDADEVYPGATDTFYDAVDQDCAGDDDFDVDRDGAATDAVPDRDGISGTDCDDDDPSVNPSAIEAWYDGVDQTCNGNDGDQDRDGYWVDNYDLRVAASGGTPLAIPGGYEGDCDDLDSSRWPTAPEYCDAVDSDCDGLLEDDDALDTSTWYADADGDGWGDTSTSAIACLQPTGFVSDGSDCLDSDASINPGATEICDGLDNDCDALLDHGDPDVTDAVTWYPDADADSFGDSSAPGIPYCLGVQPSGWTVDATDCDDSDAAQFPGATEYCNLDDDDCDGVIDEDESADVLTWYADVDIDGYGDPTVSDVDCAQPLGYVAADLATDCDDANPTTNPGVTDSVADGVDNDCDGFELCYEDLDIDSYGSATTVSSLDLGCTDAGESASSTDCDDTNASTYPGATDAVADGVDSDCDGLEACYQDADGDGYGGTATIPSVRADCSGSGESLSSSDCDDSNPGAYPGATESVADGVDADCDGYELCYQDSDLDSYGSDATLSTTTIACTDAGQAAVNGDCDDSTAAIYPGAVEAVADGVDQDCDGGDTCYQDVDGDSYGDATTTPSADLICTDSGESTLSTDCDDGVSSTFPGATEYVADGVDQDCDGGDLCQLDSDGDGYGGSYTLASVDLDCSDTSESAVSSDCDDSSASTSPAATEVCNGVDDDCDGTVDEDDAADASTWYADGDLDGWGLDSSTQMRCDQPSGYVASGGDCDDTRSDAYPGALETTADGVDQDCDGGDTCYQDLDLDTFGTSTTVASADLDCTGSGESLVSTDCDDGDSAANPGASEICNSVDDDCDGTVDEDDAVDATLWYLDADGDGFGDPGAGYTTCYAPEFFVDSALGEDCDDSGAAVNPGATEVCNGVDDNCDGTADEDAAVDATTWYLDSDLDGYGTDSASRPACSQPSGYVAAGGDCDDGAIAVNPGATEICSNGVDDDCDGLAVGCTPSGDVSLGDADAILWGENASDLAGYALSWAGDVDGDGLDDLVVAARESDASGIYSGSAYLVLGPVSSDLSLVSAHAIFRGETYGDYAGSSVAGVGDVDADGFDDLLIGASGQDAGGGNAGVAYLLFGPVSGEMDLGLADAALTGEDSGDQAGLAVSAAGDVDRDGYADFMVGSFASDLGGTNAGAAYLVLGPVTADSGLASAHARLIGEVANDHAGSALAPVGDIDGDGVTDLLVGAPGGDLGGTDSGAAYLVLGPVTGDLGLGAADTRFIGDASDEAGTAVAGAGDVDGDGLDDLIIGAPGCDASGIDAGAAYLMLSDIRGDVALNTADARLLGDTAGDAAGTSVTGDADVDGDGFDDLVVGAINDSTSYTSAGAAYLLLGPVSGDHYLSDAAARLLGRSADDLAGSSVALGGDANGDGYGDIVVGAQGEDTAGAAAGAAYLILGGGL